MNGGDGGNGHFGCEHFGRLRRVLLHRPGRALELVNGRNCRSWLFDAPPDVGRFIDEHDRYRRLLGDHGVQVLELSELVDDGVRAQIDRLPNLTYLHDVAAVSSKGAFLSAMAWPARRGEELVLAEALRRLDIPVLTQFLPGRDAFEGCLLLSPRTLLVARTQRHSRPSVAKFIPTALRYFDQVIEVDVPPARRYMHPDTIYNRLREDLALAYLPAFGRCRLHDGKTVREIDFERHMASEGVRIVHVSDSEQRRLACSFVPLEPGVIFHYDTALDGSTRRLLGRRGVELLLFHPQAMVAGGGSLRCLTLRLWRSPKAA